MTRRWKRNNDAALNERQKVHDFREREGGRERMELIRCSGTSTGMKARRRRKNGKCVRANCTAQRRQATRDGDASFSINQK